MPHVVQIKKTKNKPKLLKSFYNITQSINQSINPPSDFWGRGLSDFSETGSDVPVFPPQSGCSDLTMLPQQPANTASETREGGARSAEANVS